jgi:hypothetical protein
MAGSGQVQSLKPISAHVLPSEKKMTRFERRVLWVIVVAAALFVALTWRLFAAI